jgi:hypothetical protein
VGSEGNYSGAERLKARYDALWHAPIIFPALLRVRIPFSESFYIPLTLLHLSLIVRVISDLTLWLPGRQWGGLLNALTILLFFANTARTAITHPRSHPQ